MFIVGDCFPNKIEGLFSTILNAMDSESITTISSLEYHSEQINLHVSYLSDEQFCLSILPQD